MIKFDELKEEIAETRRQIGLTESKRRKYQLHRRLAKLEKEYKYGKMMMKKQAKTEDQDELIRT